MGQARDELAAVQAAAIETELDSEPWVWRATQGQVEVAFVGRGASHPAVDALRALERSPEHIAWARQVHSSRVLEAEEGACGEGDALISERSNLALVVVTADCVPILLAGEQSLAAVHAGWRGIAGGIVANTVDALAKREGPSSLTAWIGPAIGACCYEVDEDVAARVVEASHPAMSSPGPAGKPHLDLVRAAAHQLRTAGVETIHCVNLCTRCHPSELWSYRREGAGAGRNLAFIWRR